MDRKNFRAVRTGTVHSGSVYDDGQLCHLECGANGVYAAHGRQAYRETTQAVTCKRCIARLDKLAAQEQAAVDADVAERAAAALSRSYLEDGLLVVPGDDIPGFAIPAPPAGDEAEQVEQAQPVKLTEKERQAADPNRRNVIPLSGGSVHRGYDRDLFSVAFPRCRTGGQSLNGTRYRETDAEVTCEKCLMFMARAEQYGHTF